MVGFVRRTHTLSEGFGEFDSVIFDVVISGDYVILQIALLPLGPLLQPDEEPYPFPAVLLPPPPPTTALVSVILICSFGLDIPNRLRQPHVIYHSLDLVLPLSPYTAPLLPLAPLVPRLTCP